MRQLNLNRILTGSSWNALTRTKRQEARLIDMIVLILDSCSKAVLVPFEMRNELKVNNTNTTNKINL